jgi:hypothetical protein
VESPDAYIAVKTQLELQKIKEKDIKHYPSLMLIDVSGFICDILEELKP